MTVVSYGDGMEGQVMAAVDLAEREDQWIVLENLHLATDRFCRDLKHQLHRMAKGIANAGKKVKL